MRELSTDAMLPCHTHDTVGTANAGSDSLDSWVCQAEDEALGVSALQLLPRESLRELLRRQLTGEADAPPASSTEHLTTTPVVHTASEASFARLAVTYVARFDGAVEELAADLNAAVPDGSQLSVCELLQLLCGDADYSFDSSKLSKLLSHLDVDWAAFQHFGPAACALLSWPDFYAEPGRIGRVFRTLALPAGDFFPTDDVVDVVCAVLDDGWDAMRAGQVAKGMMPPVKWDCERVLDILQTLVSRCIDSDEVDVKDFELLDMEGAQSRAMQIGTIIDMLDIPESAAMDFVVQFLRWFWATYSALDEPQPSDPPHVCCMRGSWFAGRVLQQLTTFHDPEYIPLLSHAWFGGSWKTDTAITLACNLTSAHPSDTHDWRYIRTNHVYKIGAVLLQLRERWWTTELISLSQEMRRAANFPDGTLPPPSRIIAEVLEGLNAEWDPTVPRLQPQEREFWLKHHSHPGVGSELGHNGAVGRATEDSGEGEAAGDCSVCDTHDVGANTDGSEALSSGAVAAC